MSKAPAFQFYAQDFLSGVMDLRPKTQTIPKKRSSLKIEDRRMKNEDRKKKKEVELEVINKNSPSIDEFIDYGKALLKQLNKNEEEYDFALRSKYHTWNDDGWKNGHGRKIKNWKNTLGNTIPFLKPIYNGTSKKINQPKYSKEFEREILEGLQSE